MNSFRNRPFAGLLLALGTLPLAVFSLTGCGLFSQSWDVKLEVTGSDKATVTYVFAGGTESKGSEQKLPWSRAQNVGYGFNSVGVINAAPGTVCRIYVDGELEEEQKRPDAEGVLSCTANLQD
ncbi:hypothetical protein ACH4GE_36770 [Streptomyces tendae]|uniref:hypothetical protein n=1 Tax=Streptomyces tendae TaxID=1932 RepID=UPI0037B1D545